jgi:UDP-glucose 4-epimerase
LSRVIIFGATGTLGAYTALALNECGFNLIAVGHRESDNGFFRDYGIPYYSVHIENIEDFDRLPSDYTDHVLHFAGSMPARMATYEPQLYIDSIVTGTYNILEYAREHNASSIVFTHTRADSNYLMGTKEPIPSDIQRKFPLKGDHSIYTICKNAAVDLIEHYYHQYNLRRFVLRCPTIYAYHPDKYFYVDGEKRIIAYRYMIDRAIEGLPIEVWGDPEREKEVSYVKDFTQLIRACLDSNCQGGIYNAGRGVGVSLLEQISGIVKVFSPPSCPSRLVFCPDKPNARQFIHDISKARNELGYCPKYNYHDLLVDFKKEMESNRFSKLCQHHSLDKC